MMVTGTPCRPKRSIKTSQRVGIGHIGTYIPEVVVTNVVANTTNVVANTMMTERIGAGDVEIERVDVDHPQNRNHPEEQADCEDEREHNPSERTRCSDRTDPCFRAKELQTCFVLRP